MKNKHKKNNDMSAPMTEKSTDARQEQESPQDFYETADPALWVFLRKKTIGEELFGMKAEELETVAEKPWYGEYLALLPIPVERPALKRLAQSFLGAMQDPYFRNMDSDYRHLLTLAMLQLVPIEEVPVPIESHQWPEKVREDIQGALRGQESQLATFHEKIAIYHVSRQNEWRHEKREMRVAFLVESRTSYEKIAPVYHALKARDDAEASLILVPTDAQCVL